METIPELLRQLTPLESAFALGFSLAAVLFGISQQLTQPPTQPPTPSDPIDEVKA